MKKPGEQPKENGEELKLPEGKTVKPVDVVTGTTRLQSTNVLNAPMAFREFRERTERRGYNMQIYTFFLHGHPNYEKYFQKLCELIPESAEDVEYIINQHKKHYVNPEQSTPEKLYVAYLALRKIGVKDEETTEELSITEEQKQELLTIFEAFGININEYKSLEIYQQQAIFAVIQLLKNSENNTHLLAELEKLSIKTLLKLARAAGQMDITAKELLLMALKLKKPDTYRNYEEVEAKNSVIWNSANGIPIEVQFDIKFDIVKRRYSLELSI